MSCWTYITGSITVDLMGRTQAEKTYILQTVLDHLPRVEGSEGDMEIYINQKRGFSNSCSVDEFGNCTNNLVIGRCEQYKSSDGFLQTQDNYILTIDGNLRDKMFDETFKSFNRWLCRLSKRVGVEDICIKIVDTFHKSIILTDSEPYRLMNEDPSWVSEEKEPNWCEYLMWDRGKNTDMPLMLAYKYYSDDEDDSEAEHRINYWRR